MCYLRIEYSIKCGANNCAIAKFKIIENNRVLYRLFVRRAAGQPVVFTENVPIDNKQLISRAL